MGSMRTSFVSFFLRGKKDTLRSNKRFFVAVDRKLPKSKPNSSVFHSNFNSVLYY